MATSPIAAEGGYSQSAPLALDKAGRFMPWYPVFNLTGQPAISLPAGFGADGMPLSVQLVGRSGDEETLYSLAGQIESRAAVGGRAAADRHPLSAARCCLVRSPAAPLKATQAAR